MDLLASATQHGFPHGWMGVCMIIYFVVWAAGFILQMIINKRLKELVKRGDEGIPETRFIYQSIGSGIDRFGYFYKQKYKATGDSRFIMMCEIYKILILLIALMLVGFFTYFMAFR